MRAACYVAYQFALAGRYHEGADFIRKSGIQDFLADAEDYTMLTPLSVLYNRVMAQFGLAAFEAGDIEQTYEILDRNNTTRLQHLLLGTADSVIKLAAYAEPRTRLSDDDNVRRVGGRNNARGGNATGNLNGNRAGNRSTIRAR
ncbi:hypothetical protein O3M35_001517 [Rhynocoris fuscipes]|uniref:Eukaryotic translation initiation factor 3 subunit C N-terminal domain-containing protein n=1 Tax=Rhynocoris fuscipes TaxID=488301 RepID=A0AAW1CMS9_9HEMI